MVGWGRLLSGFIAVMVRGFSGISSGFSQGREARETTRYSKPSIAKPEAKKNTLDFFREAARTNFTLIV
jgi:hypothetical protein